MNHLHGCKVLAKPLGLVKLGPISCMKVSQAPDEDESLDHDMSSRPMPKFAIDGPGLASVHSLYAGGSPFLPKDVSRSSFPLNCTSYPISSR